jgi:hypothetical protein
VAEGNATQGPTLGRGRIPPALRQGPFSRRLQSLSAGGGALSPRDLRQLSGRPLHPLLSSRCRS